MGTITNVDPSSEAIKRVWSPQVLSSSLASWHLQTQVADKKQLVQVGEDTGLLEDTSAGD